MLVKHILVEISRQDQVSHAVTYRRQGHWPLVFPEPYNDPNEEFSNQEIPGSLQSLLDDFGINFQGQGSLSPKNAQQAELTDRVISAIEKLAVNKSKDLSIGPAVVKYTLPDGIVWVKTNKPSYYNSVLWQPPEPRF